MNFRSLLRESIQESRQELLDEYWGRIGSGIICYARDTGNFLLALRSADVEKPNTWAGIGGAVSGAPGEKSARSPLDGAKQEFKEETGFSGSFEQIIPLYVFRDHYGKFEYYNFLGVVSSQFDPQENWETKTFAWLPLKGLLSLPRKHPGLKMLLADPESLAILKKISSEKR